jgi:hypothetical protein
VCPVAPNRCRRMAATPRLARPVAAAVQDARGVRPVDGPRSPVRTSKVDPACTSGRPSTPQHGVDRRNRLRPLRSTISLLIHRNKDLVSAALVPAHLPRRTPCR